MSAFSKKPNQPAVPDWGVAEFPLMSESLADDGNAILTHQAKQIHCAKRSPV